MEKRAPYQVLDGESTRLLESDSKDLKYKFHYVKIDQLPRYTAISYTWGSAVFDHTILVENIEMSITKNLHDLLRTFNNTFRFHKSWVWIDAICIDQTDINERNEQVAKMGKIYLGASEVFVWLGLATPESKLAMQKIKELAEFYLTLPRRPGRGYLTEAGTKQVTADNPMLYGPPGSDCYNAWQAIFALCKREWWMRVWIVQEATCSTHNVLFFAGNDYCFYDYLEMAMLICHHLDLEGKVDSTFVDDNNRPFRRLTNIREGRRNETEHIINLTSLMNRSGVMSCTDPRDKIYAMLGFASNVNSVTIPIDYSKSVYEVYVDYVRWFMATATGGHELDFLLDAGSGLDRETQIETMTEFPSWVPDWMTYDTLIRPHSLFTIFQGGDRKSQSIYNASGQQIPQIENSEDRQLRVKGFTIDSISKLSGFSLDLEDPEMELQALEEIGTSSVYHSREPIKEVCRRTLQADLCHKERWASARPLYVDIEMLRQRPEDLPLDQRRERRSKIRGMKSASCCRRLLRTSCGYIGLVNAAVKSGDEICVLFGGTLCYVLRRMPDGKACRFIGECYLHGFMDGEALNVLETGKSKEEIFVLV